MKKNKSWGGQGNGRGGYYPRKDLPQNLPWRQQLRGFPYKDDPLKDKKYLKDRAELFRKNGNGWWWNPSIIKLRIRR
jgi:hypothetical protein|tara:strand:+ start:2226 stop:2456 length:231 start_codon:yes stop_codon:yes gene_type:complete